MILMERRKISMLNGLKEMMKKNQLERTKKILTLIEKDKERFTKQLEKLEEDIKQVPNVLQPKIQVTEWKDDSKLSDELKGLKWEIVSEPYIKNKFAQYHRWFIQLENKITKLDTQLNVMTNRIENIEHELSYHENMIIDKTVQKVAEQEQREKEEVARKAVESPRVLPFLDEKR